MRESSVKTILERLADRAGDDFDPPTTAQFRARRQRRRRTTIATFASSLAVVAVVAVAVALPRGHSTPSARESQSSVTLPPLGNVTAQQLERYRWSALPTSPIPPRAGAAEAWTGTQLFVWGGMAGESSTYADGAVFTPSSGTWSKLPAAPLSARSGATAVWTGDRVVVWGGISPDTTELRDGAVYDPAVRRWTAMAAAPPSAGRESAFVAGSGFALRLTQNAAFAATVIGADAFDPVRNAWTRLPDIHVPARDSYTNATAAQVGDRMIAWVSNGYSFELDSAHRRWTGVPYSPASAGCIYQALPTRAGVVFPASPLSISCGGDIPDTIPSKAEGMMLDLATGRSRTIPFDLTSDAEATSVWTGSALVDVDAVGINGIANDRSHYSSPAGATKAWDPRTDRWLSLPRAPSAPDEHSDDPVTWTWTGTQLIGVGRFASGTTGLVLGPG